MTFIIGDSQHNNALPYAECYVECRVLIIMLTVIMLSVVMLCVVMLSVVAP